MARAGRWGAARAAPRLVERYRFDTAANYLATARGTLKAAWLLGMVGTDVWRRAAEVEASKGVALPAGHYVWDHKRAVLRFRTTKGNRQRESACPAWVQGPMAAYLRLRGPVSGPLFVKMRGSTLALRMRRQDGSSRVMACRFAPSRFALWHRHRRSHALPSVACRAVPAGLRVSRVRVKELASLVALDALG